MLCNFIAFLQADFLPFGPDSSIFWIFNILVVIVSFVLSIPFIKAEPAKNMYQRYETNKLVPFRNYGSKSKIQRKYYG